MGKEEEEKGNQLKQHSHLYTNDTVEERRRRRRTRLKCGCCFFPSCIVSYSCIYTEIPLKAGHNNRLQSDGRTPFIQCAIATSLGRHNSNNSNNSNNNNNIIILTQPVSTEPLYTIDNIGIGNKWIHI